MIEKMKKTSKYWFLILTGIVLIGVLNLVACSKRISTVYTNTIYKYLSDGISKVTDKIVFPLGEILMYLAMLLVICFVVIGIVYLVLQIANKNENAFCKFARGYFKTFLMILVLVIFIYTLVWTIPIRANTLKNEMLREKKLETYSFGIDELLALRATVVDRMNALAIMLHRDENESIQYDDWSVQRSQSVLAMKSLETEYPRLAGYYPTMKNAICSDFLEWMGIGGYTYPFTMELTCNRYEADLFYPTLYLHEMAHHKGYYLESDATFLSILACIESENPLIQYSGYQEAYYYIESDVRTYFNELNSDEGWKRYNLEVMPSRLVVDDFNESLDKARSNYEEHVNEFLEDNVSGTAKAVSTVGWSTQAELLGDYVYDGAVELLMFYYDKNKGLQ